MMKPFEYVRPRTLGEAVEILDRHGPEAQLLAGGTDLVIELRHGWKHPKVVVDIKRIDELYPSIIDDGERISISATAVMADIAEHSGIRATFPALVEAAVVIGSVQIRSRATLAGNICNGSPAADSAPPLLVYGAEVIVVGPGGRRAVSIDEFIVGPGEVDLARGEMVAAIRLPYPDRRIGAAFTRLTRRRGTDLASITLCCSVDDRGVTRVAFGSVGPRAFLSTDATGVLADPYAPELERTAVLDRVFDRASPSVRSLRASPDYRLAMLRVLGFRALDTAIDRLSGSAA